MPTATYMQIDPRHDHSLRIPRPDLSVELGTPNACNACNACHADRDARWAASNVKAWFGLDSQGYQRFAPAFSHANAGVVGASAQLRAVADNAAQPVIARATPMSALNANADAATMDVVAKGLRDPSPLIRLGALNALTALPAKKRLRYATPLLSDPLKAAIALEPTFVPPAYANLADV